MIKKRGGGYLEAGSCIIRGKLEERTKKGREEEKGLENTKLSGGILWERTRSLMFHVLEYI